MSSLQSFKEFIPVEFNIDSSAPLYSFSVDYSRHFFLFLFFCSKFPRQRYQKRVWFIVSKITNRNMEEIPRNSNMIQSWYKTLSNLSHTVCSVMCKLLGSEHSLSCTLVFLFHVLGPKSFSLLVFLAIMALVWWKRSMVIIFLLYFLKWLTCNFPP